MPAPPRPPRDGAPLTEPPPADPTEVLSLLDRLPDAMEPMDVEAIDGYLCGVLLQPTPIPTARWLPVVLDVEGRPVPPGTDVSPLRAAIERRHRELEYAIVERQWFDPWVFEPDDESVSPSEVVATWVTGFAMATERFPALTAGDPPALTEPLALLYRHLDPDDLEDADALLAEIETLEPPAELAEAVEDLVRATLLIADVSRPDEPRRPAPPAAPAKSGRSPSPAAPRRAGSGPAGSRPPARKGGGAPRSPAAKSKPRAR